MQFDWKVQIIKSCNNLKILSINYKLEIVIIIVSIIISIIIAFHALLYLSDYLRTN